ncbi:MAG: hypothetical protein R2824_16110 [Saprospiraceae bacterium]|nr:hypothetical protein [Lewinella sp.]
MRIWLLSIFLLFSYSAFAQQNLINGVVSVFNSKYFNGATEYVHLAEVKERLGRSQKTTTDINGKFTLVLVGVPKHESFNIVVTKNNLEVVNFDELKAVAGQKELVKVYLASPQLLADYRKQIYRVGKTAAEKKLADQISLLQSERDSLIETKGNNLIQIKSLENEIASLKEEYQNVEKKAQQLAEKYARVNLDVELESLQMAFKEFQNGDLDKAIEILNRDNLVPEARERIEKREMLRRMLDSLDRANNFRIQRLIPGIQFKADLHEISLEIDSVEYCYELLFELDSLNIKTLVNYTNFLSNQNKVEEAIDYAERLVKLSDDPIGQASHSITLALLYDALEEFNEAEKVLSSNIAKLEQEDNTTIPTLEAQYRLYLSRGSMYGEWKRIDKQYLDYSTALRVIDELFQKDSVTYRPRRAFVYATIGNLDAYIDGKSSYYYKKKALEEYELLAKTDSKYQTQVNQLKTQIYISRAIETGQDALGDEWKNDVLLPELSQEAGETQQFDRYITLIQMGSFHALRGEAVEMEKYYKEAFEIIENLVVRNPDRFEPELAMGYSMRGQNSIRAGKPQDHYFKKAFVLAEKHYHLARMQDLANNLLNEYKVALEEIYPFWAELKAQEEEYVTARYWDERIYSNPETEKEKAELFGKLKKHQTDILTLWRNAFSKYPDNIRVREKLGDSYGDMAKLSLLSKEFEKAAEYAKIGELYTTRNDFASVYLVLALAYQGEMDEARPIIIEHKDQSYIIDKDEKNVGFNPGWILVLKDELINLSNAGVILPDINVFKEFYSPLTWSEITLYNGLNDPEPMDMAIYEVEEKIDACWDNEDVNCLLEQHEKLYKLKQEVGELKDDDYVESLSDFAAYLIHWKKYEAAAVYVDRLLTISREMKELDKEEYQEMIHGLAALYQMNGRTEEMQALLDSLGGTEIDEIQTLEEAELALTNCMVKGAENECFFAVTLRKIEIHEANMEKIDYDKYRGDLLYIAINYLSDKEEPLTAFPYVEKWLKSYDGENEEKQKEKRSLFFMFENYYPASSFPKENARLKELAGSP